MEAQFVHYDASYATFEEALNASNSGSIAIVSVLFQLSPNPNGQLVSSLEAIAAAASFEEQAQVSVPAFSLGYFTSLLTEQSPFFKYSGSLTYPGCNEGVSWIVMQTPMNISDDQVCIPNPQARSHSLSAHHSPWCLPKCIIW
jgi:carbonic anhydrase